MLREFLTLPCCNKIAFLPYRYVFDNLITVHVGQSCMISRIIMFSVRFARLEFFFSGLFPGVWRACFGVACRTYFGMAYTFENSRVIQFIFLCFAVLVVCCLVLFTTYVRGIIF